MFEVDPISNNLTYLQLSMMIGCHQQLHPHITNSINDTTSSYSTISKIQSKRSNSMTPEELCSQLSTNAFEVLSY